MKNLVNQIGDNFTGGVLEIDATHEENPDEYIKAMETEIEKSGYKILDVLKSQKYEIYHIHIKKKSKGE